MTKRPKIDVALPEELLNSFAKALVAGKNLVPNPAAGIIAFLTFINYSPFHATANN